MRATHLRIDQRADPVGLDNRQPRFSWVVESDRGGARQDAYQLVVASTADDAQLGNADVWDSGRVPSSRTAHIVYDGPPLASAQRCAWSVRTWDAEGNDEGFAAPATFEMGLLEPSDWRAAWIAPPPRLRERAESRAGVDVGEHESGRPTILRRTFDAGSTSNARLYVTARGLYDVRINGARVGDQHLTPGWTDYRFRIPYQTYDVGVALRSDATNLVEVVLADGWYSGRVAWLRQLYGTTPSLLLQLHVDGEVVLASDASWEAATGEWLWADLLTGEARDLRDRTPSRWEPVVVADPPDATTRLVAHDGPPVRVLDELPARSVVELEPGTFLADLGQNMVGWARVGLAGDHDAGDVVTVRHAEVLDADGRIYTDNLRRAQATDVYVLAADTHVLEPSFTFHGFRYVEIKGVETPPAVTGVVIGSDTPRTGTFECSNAMVNQLQRNIEWGQRGNFLEAPTDCPQRDERLGWMGDAQIFVGTAAWNADVAPFFRKWLRDVVDGRSERGAFPDVAPVVDAGLFGEAAPAWGDAGVIVPWVLYERYGDERFLEDSFEAMAGWVDYVTDANPDGLWLNRRNNDYGDWLAVNSDTPKDVLASAFYFRSADLVARAAEVLDRKEDAARYRALADGIRDAFQEAFVTPGGRVVGHTQTSYVLALAFGLIPPGLVDAAAEQLVDRITQRRGLGSAFVPGTLDTGFLGVGHLLPTLTSVGRVDLAYALLESEEFPSWGYSIAQGATTIWERWDGWTAARGFQTPTMNSFNHYSLGSVGDWLYGVVAGIQPDPDAVGFERFHIRPRPGGTISWARATYESIRGTIVSDWRIVDGTITLDVTIPANTFAGVCLPGGDAVEVGSGTHRFEGPYESQEEKP